MYFTDKNDGKHCISACPYGTELDKNDGNCINIKQKNDSCKNRIRNVCMDEIEKLTMQTDASGKKTVLLNGKPLQTPTTALYWGGIIGDASGKFPGNSDGSVTTKYLNNVISFVKEKNINVLMLSVDSTSKFMFNNNGEWVVKNLLENPDIKNSNIEIGIVVYIRPKDSPYTYDENAWGAPISGSKDINSCNTIKAPTSKCTPNKNYTNCGLDKDPTDCKKKDETCYDGSTEYSCCKGLACNHDSKKCEACGGCPNIAGQVIKWVADVNKSSSGKKITYFTVDGEDAGEYNSVCGWNQISQLNKHYNAGLIKYGFAKGLAAGITGTVENNNMVMPETYWYMNETTPCTGSAYQLNNMPEICTTNISYRNTSLVNKPAEFVNWLMTSSRCGADKSMNGLLKNIKSNPDVFWPMFSLENLSMDGNASKCLASEFFPCSSKSDCGKQGAKPQLCGTFDGFAYWDWDKFYMFYVYFAYVVGVKQIGIYEAQFIPPNWFDSKKYPFPYTRNNCNPPLPAGKTYKKCDPNWSTKGNWCKFGNDTDFSTAYGTCSTPDPKDLDKVTYCNCITSPPTNKEDIEKLNKICPTFCPAPTS